MRKAGAEEEEGEDERVKEAAKPETYESLKEKREKLRGEVNEVRSQSIHVHGSAARGGGLLWVFPSPSLCTRVGKRDLSFCKGIFLKGEKARSVGEHSVAGWLFFATGCLLWLDIF